MRNEIYWDGRDVQVEFDLSDVDIKGDIIWTDDCKAAYTGLTVAEIRRLREEAARD